MSGEIVYFQLDVADASRAREFYGPLFGWEFDEGNAEEGFQIGKEGLPGGVYGRAPETLLRVYIDVPDIDAAVERVRELDGEAGEVQESGGGGRFAHCRDNQGVAFSLWQQG
ncbi:MAG TPA: VOC family protein [Candidatus Limnocylindria bacterium]|nr:VOC family protein [Candidatus Limnocylindria bacterium]